jgi:predicted HTH domain antitoxin
VSEECPGGCCPHDGTTPDSECPDDLPGAALPERAVHLYACQMLSTYKIATITGTDRQRVTRLLRESGATVSPSGTGRRLTRRTADDERLERLMVSLYQEQRMPSLQIAELTGLSEYTVRSRLRARGVPIRTRGSYNREDRAMISSDDLTALYLQAGLSAEEVADLLGVSRKVVLRSAHDQGLLVRLGGAPPSRGPAEIELLAVLYSDPDVLRVLDRHGVPVVATPGPIWERFPVPHELTTGLVTDLYEGCGLSLPHIELLTGRPMAAARSLLLTAGIQLRPAGGRCPFMRRWRQSGG